MRISKLLGLLLLCPIGVNAAGAQPAAAPCPLRVEAVAPDGRRLVAHAEVLDHPSATVTQSGDTACVATGTAGPETVRVLVTADGYQAHLTEPLEIRPNATRDLQVMLVPPFAESLTVEGRHTNLVGIADSASTGAIGVAELATRPLIRAGDILSAVPGVAITQHSSGGHAPIILLRGYNLDHGTDFATTFEGAPLNLPSHAHGQGYTDTNFLIEDLVQRIEFQKGPYASRTGNFSTAGAANIELVDRLDAPVVRIDAGGRGFRRVLGLSSFGRPGRQLLLGAEASHDDGPSEVPDDFGRLKAIARYSTTTNGAHLTLTYAGFRGAWNATDGYPQRALDRGYLTRFGTLDATDGGRTQQHLLVLRSTRSNERRLIDVGGFARYYDFDLFSNLTFWTISPESGDQIWQSDRRGSAGAHAVLSRFLGAQPGRLEVTGGLQTRHDLARVRLRNSQARVALAKRTDSGTLLPATVYDNRISESSLAPFVEARLRVSPWLRVTAGSRLDVVRMQVSSDRRENSGTVWSALASPKGSLVLGPWRGTEAYANAGFGFHSNHAAGVTQRVDPTEGTSVRADGSVVEGSPALVRTRGAEVGLRTAAGTRAQSSVALWLLDSDSELIYTGEDGVTSPERPGRRYGVEWLNALTLRTWLRADLDLAWSSAQYRTDPQGEGRNIPDAASTVIGGGVTVGTPRLGASLRGRYVGARPLQPSGDAVVRGAFVANGSAEIQLRKGLRLTVQGFNLFDRVYDDTAYYYATRLRDPSSGALEPAATSDYVTHPAQPRTLRAGLRLEF